MGRETLEPPAGAPHTPNGRVRVDEGDATAVMQIEPRPRANAVRRRRCAAGSQSPSAVSLVPAICDGRFFWFNEEFRGWRRD
ncbi:hypothetical protein CBM2626_B50203 [Cupriavidus taiwanensis]|nr:hypothetical protein CBM2626_B50203 [Cupriavidus taiwanensis]